MGEMNPELTFSQVVTMFRARCAEAIGRSFLLLSDPGSRLAGVSDEDLRSRVLNKIAAEPEMRMYMAMALDLIQQAVRDVIDFRVSELLQDGVKTFDLAGQMVEVERAKDRLVVRNILDGAGLNVADGAFVLFIDSRCAGSAALRRWQELVKDDTHLMIVPLQVVAGQRVADVVAAKRQDESEDFTR